MYKMIKGYQAPITKKHVINIENEITDLFNAYTDKGELTTIMVVVETKDRVQHQKWAEVGNFKPENIKYIVFYEVAQEPKFETPAFLN